MAATPQPIRSGEAIREQIVEARCRGRRIGLVPTMGALHAGHLSLVETARRQCDAVVVTIFVNPTQFGPGEDFQAYPRDLDRDLHLLAEHNVDWIFVPEADAVYLPDHQTYVDVGPVAAPYEGAVRPVHFRGVATIVLKLFLLAPADVAYFGQKDYQQTVVVRQMVRDLNVPIEVIVCPTVREPDGLALSSRNAYLSPSDRQRATILYEALLSAQRRRHEGERRGSHLREAIVQRLQSADDVVVDYAAIVAEGTMNEVEQVEGPVVAVAAIRIGGTRLLDNLRIE